MIGGVSGISGTIIVAGAAEEAVIMGGLRLGALRLGAGATGGLILSGVLTIASIGYFGYHSKWTRKEAT